MGRKLDALMGKAFRSSKCKTLLKLTIARLKILRNKRELQCKQLRRDVAQLLQNGQEASARLRIEQIFREQNILDAYLLIGGYSETVAERMMSIKMQKTCPNDLKESIASLVFAAPRCAELPELQDVRSLFAAKYGKEFTESAVELRPDCGVNKRIIEKLSTRVPSPEVKLRLMKEIASEHGIEWNFEETETEMLKAAEDLLDGSKKYSETKHTTSKPEDGTNGPVKTSSISSGGPDTVKQQVSGTYFSQPSPITPQLHVSTKDEQELLSSAKQGYGETTSAGIYNSNSIHDPLHVKEESVASPNSETDVDPNISEYNLYDRKRMEGKMDYDRSMGNAAAFQNSSSSDTHHDFDKFAKKDGVSADLKRESNKYTDVASAAQAAFESAAYAAAAARAAVELSKGEPRNKKFNHRANDSRELREAMPESEHELDKTILREQKEGKYAVPHGVESGTSSTLLSHILFVDGILIFGNGTIQEAKCLDRISKLFTSTTGMVLNLQKSAVFFFNIPQAVKILIQKFLPFTTPTSEAIKNLGFYLKTNDYHVGDWLWLLQKLKNCVTLWCNRWISMAGRFVLIKSVLEAIPVYWLSLAYLSKTILKNIKKICLHFLWAGNKEKNSILLIKWSLIAQPKSEGGWGLKDLPTFSKVLAAKGHGTSSVNRDCGSKFFSKNTLCHLLYWSGFVCNLRNTQGGHFSGMLLFRVLVL